MLRWDGAMVLPTKGCNKLKVKILQSRHDAPIAGHRGRDKTRRLVRRDYYWRTMKDFVNRYVDECHECTRNKSRRHATSLMASCNRSQSRIAP